MTRVRVLSALVLSSLVARPSFAQDSCLEDAMALGGIEASAPESAFLVAGESFTAPGVSDGCAGVVMVGPVSARVRVTLFAASGEALASSEEDANSAYAMRCAFQGAYFVHGEVLEGAGEFFLATGPAAGNERARWEGRRGRCFAPPAGVAASALDVGEAPAIAPEEALEAIADAWVERGWALTRVVAEPDGATRIRAEGCLRVAAVPGGEVRIESIRRRGPEIAFCVAEPREAVVDGNDPFVVLQRPRIAAPAGLPNPGWTEALGAGPLTHHVSVHGSAGDRWRAPLMLASGCHRIVAFGRVVIELRDAGRPLRQRHVRDQGEIFVCGDEERSTELALRFIAPESTAHIYVGSR